MKLKVLIKFRDKITGELHEVDSVFDADDQRAKELLEDNRKLVAKVKEEKTEEAIEAPKKATKSKKSSK
jgi:hypothetical protein